MQRKPVDYEPNLVTDSPFIRSEFGSPSGIRLTPVSFMQKADDGETEPIAAAMNWRRCFEYFPRWIGGVYA